MGAVNRLVLTGRDPALAKAYGDGHDVATLVVSG